MISEWDRGIKPLELNTPVMSAKDIGLRGIIVSVLETPNSKPEDEIFYEIGWKNPMIPSDLGEVAYHFSVVSEFDIISFLGNSKRKRKSWLR